MGKTDVAIIIFSFLLFGSYFLFRQKFLRASVILYTILCFYIGVVDYNGYQGVIELYVGNEAGSLGAVPEIVLSILITFWLFMIYSFINIMLLSFF